MIRWLALALWLPVAAAAQEFPAQLDRHVNDFSEALDPEDETELRTQLEAVERETGVQVVVVTVRRRAEYGGPLSVEDWSTALFNAWGIGTAGRDDGILIMVAVEDREMRLALGSGYGPEFDAAAVRVVENAILPAFREQAYAQGLSAGIKALRPRIIDPFLAGNPPPQDAPESFPWIPAGFGALFLATILGLNNHRRIGNLFMRFQSCPSCSQRALKRTRAVKVRPTLNNTGLETVLTVCTSCGHRDEREVILSKTDRRSRRSGGGSGGGRSSGGGATGRW